MLELTWVEVFFRLIPEVFAIIWAIYTISIQTISKYKYLICSISSAVVTFIARLLPIHPGIHTIIASVFIICILVIVGIQLIKSIFGVIITTGLLIIGEMINMIILNIFNINLDVEFHNPFIKCILGIPSIMFLILSIVLIRFLLNKKEGIKDDFKRKNCNYNRKKC